MLNPSLVTSGMKRFAELNRMLTLMSVGFACRTALLIAS